MKSQSQHQAAYWDKVAVKISASRTPDRDLVGYHSPYDAYARAVAVGLLDRFTSQVPDLNCIAELGSGAGLNLRYMSQLKPSKLLAFDCSFNLLALAKANLADLSNVTFTQTDGYSLPVPADAKVDLLFTVTVLQHITNAEMFQAVTAAMNASNADYILLLEDTKIPSTQPTPDYVLRTPLEYQVAFGSGYTVVSSEFISLTWASRFSGVMHRLCGLYNKHEGAAMPPAVRAISHSLMPLARLLDKTIPGRFGMTGLLFKRS